MIEIISKVRINSIYLGEKKEVLKETLASINYYFELNKNKEIVTLSTRLAKEFILDGKIINFENINNFLQDNNHRIQDSLYYFEDLHLNLYINFEKKVFLEILIYSDEVAHFYKSK